MKKKFKIAITMTLLTLGLFLGLYGLAKYDGIDLIKFLKVMII